MNRLILLPILLTLILPGLFAQNKVITGTVTSVIKEEGPLNGVTVQIKGSSSGTFTDRQGKYKLTLTEKADTLIFSFMGLKRMEVAIAGRSVIDVEMEADIYLLDEVAVTSGYGIKRSARSSSALSQVITGDKLNTLPITDINSALAGKVAGLQYVGQSTVKLNDPGILRLRGNSGFGTGTNVIFVVDGTVVPDLDVFNLDNIDNASVLSGPAATALLGSQGANGAVIITTKSAGTVDGQSTGIEINSGFLISSVYILPEYQNDYAGGSMYEMNNYKYSDTDPSEWKSLDGKFYPDYSNDINWGPRMEGQEYIPWYSWYPGTKNTGKTARLNPQPGNVKDFYDKGLTFNNNISFDRTGEVFNIRAVVGRVNVKGNIPGTSKESNFFTVKISYDVLKKLTLAANLNFFTTLTSGDFFDGFSNQTSGSFNQWFHRDLDMNILRELKDLKSPTGILASWNHFDPVEYRENSLKFYKANYWFNFYTYQDFNKLITKNNRLFGDVSLNYRITDGLDFKITYRKQVNSSWTEQRAYCELFESQENSWMSVAALGDGYYKSSSSILDRQNIETLVSFNKLFGNVQVNLNAGSDFFSSTWKSNASNTVNGLYIRNLFSISNSIDEPFVSNDRTEEKYNALFVRCDVGFKSFIFAGFTLRNDWFSTLPAENNSIISKSFGASFIFSDLLKIRWLNFGKVHISWGEIPSAIGPYIYPGTSYSLGQYKWNGNFAMTAPDQLVDQNIRGGVKIQKEAGLELRFLNNRAGIAATYWNGTEKNIPYPVPISGFSGSYSSYLNTGKISKMGVDVILNIVPVKKSNFEWDLNLTFSNLIKNEVVRITDGVDKIVAFNFYSGGVDAPALVHAVDRPWGEIYGWGMKLFKGKPELDPNGLYIPDRQIYFGNVLPRLTGGVQNRFRIMKRFSLIASLEFQNGGKYVSMSDFWGTFSGLTARTSGLNDRGVPIRDPVENGGGVHISGVDAETHEEADYYLDAQSYFMNFYELEIYDPFIYSLSYIKFRELSVGYDLPLEKMGTLKQYIRSVKIALVAQNFWLIYGGNRGFDPSEIQYVNGETGQFPGTRSFGVNLKINF